MIFNSKSRKNRIMVWVSDEEKILIETKAEYYNYKSIAAYIRDATIYEKITRVELKNGDEICNLYSTYNKDLKRIKKDLRNLIKYNTFLDDISIQTIKSLIFNISNNQNEIYKLINDKLNYEVWQEINRKKQMEQL